jgi:hypothetical protein
LQDEGVRDLGYDHARRTLVSSKRRMVDEGKGRDGGRGREGQGRKAR